MKIGVERLVGGRYVGRKEFFWGRKDVEKANNFGQGRMCFLFIPKMASTASSTTGALMVSGSLQP
jgi:hypothetical protein